MPNVRISDKAATELRQHALANYRSLDAQTRFAVDEFLENNRAALKTGPKLTGGKRRKRT